MKLHRIYGIVLRFMFYFKASLDRMTDAFYYPVIDLVIWGLTSLFFRSFVPNASQIILMLISGILFWIIVWRGQYEITVNFLEELWSENLINIFSSPLKFKEWVSALLIVGIIKSLLSFSFAAFVAFLLYQTQIFTYGFYLLPFAFLLIMSGWVIGFFIMGILVRYGTRVQTFAWAAITMISPFSAIYYPVSVLPDWAQKVAFAIPTTYVFEGAREIIFQGTFDQSKLLISFALNIFYLIPAVIYLRKSFQKALENGLINLH